MTNDDDKLSFVCDRGRKYRFNDHVCMELMLGVPLENRTGRLVQVRKGCGQFGSNIYLVRLRDGTLMTFENVLIRHVNDEKFVDAFYRSNGMDAPLIPDQPIYDSDSITVEYTIKHKWPETGFVVDAPSQPQTPGCFALMVASRKD